MKKSLLMIAGLISLNASAVEFYCAKGQLDTGFNVSLNEKGGVLSAKGVACKMVNIKYRPNSPKYQGWTRIAPSKECPEFGEVLIHTVEGEVSNVDFLSMSPELLEGKEGFAQLGLPSFEPGSGLTMKYDLRCYPR